jgi:hypothetical protein
MCMPLSQHRPKLMLFAFFSPTRQRATADSVLNALKQKPDSWTKVDLILDTSRSVSSKFFALSILEEMIQFRWKLLPPEQREAVRSFIVAKVIAVRGACGLTAPDSLPGLNYCLRGFRRRCAPMSAVTRLNVCLCRN